MRSTKYIQSLYSAGVSTREIAEILSANKPVSKSTVHRWVKKLALVRTVENTAVNKSLTSTHAKKGPRPAPVPLSDGMLRVELQKVLRRMQKEDETCNLTVGDFSPLPTTCPVENVPFTCGPEAVRHNRGMVLERVDTVNGWRRDNVIILSRLASKRMKRAGLRWPDGLLAKLKAKQAGAV